LNITCPSSSNCNCSKYEYDENKTVQGADGLPKVITERLAACACECCYRVSQAGTNLTCYDGTSNFSLNGTINLFQFMPNVNASIYNPNASNTLFFFGE